METIHVGLLSCYSQWTIETAIGNLGDEICQDYDPYANIAQQGVLCAQLNSILAMFPHLNLGKNGSLPRGVKDLGQGYTLLRACQNTAKPVTDAKANVILKYWEEQGWPNLDVWPHTVKQWSHLQLPNGQKAHSRWYELHSMHSLQKTTCIKVFTFTLLFPLLDISFT